MFGTLFALQSSPAPLMVFGVLVTACNTLLSLSYHPYQSELYPTRIRARAVGFVYSASRISTVLTGYMIARLLDWFGTPGVFSFITGSMLAVMLVIGIYGPRTKGRSLEEIAH